MSTQKYGTRLRSLLFVLLCIAVLSVPAGTVASPQAIPASQGDWWNTTPEPENPSPYYDSILYSEIAPMLREIELSSNRVKVDVIGQSAGGRNLFLVTLSAPEAMGRLGQYQAIRNTMLKDPAKAQEMIDKLGDFKVPVFVNGSIHGNEYTGVDASIRLIEKLAFDDSEEVQQILQNVILLVNVVQNPDGRVMGTRYNANGFDLNRDFITQSQPEVQATVRVLTEWNPMVVLDLHGFVNPMLIEPATPPHNPNYEYDLYIKWAFREAEAMQAELLAQTGFGAQIPFRDMALGWDDWAPSYVPMYGMFHGSYGHTLETSYRDERGVDAHYAAVWGALKFVSQNRQQMVHDQIEIFRRGFLDLPQMLIPDELLAETPFDQLNTLTVKDFPAAYVIPSSEPFQLSQHQPARLIDFLLANDVQVDQASQGFALDGVSYPKGTYIVWMDQPKRGLANAFLEDGPDLSGITGLTFYAPPSVWSNPLLWGVSRAVMQDEMATKTHPVSKADAPQGSAEGGKAGAYLYLPTSLQAFKATNELLARGETLYRTKAAFQDRGRTFDAGAIIIPPVPSLANELANRYALNVFAVKSMPANLTSMKPQRIAVYADAGTGHALRQLGFGFTSVSTADLNAGALSSFDVFVNLSESWIFLSASGRASVASFFAAGGDYVGLRATGASFAKSAGVIDFDSSSGNGNAIVMVGYTPGDSIAAGYRAEDYAFVYNPVWFTRLGTGVEVTARVDSGAFLVSGFWPNWQSSGANAQPIVIHKSTGSSSVTLIGLDATFQGHPENAFRLIGNAIFSGLD
jgi:hypothetical protein